MKLLFQNNVRKLVHSEQNFFHIVLKMKVTSQPGDFDDQFSLKVVVAMVPLAVTCYVPYATPPQ